MNNVPLQDGKLYNLSVQAKNIFDFLKQTFNQMPRPVQVFGWLVFLCLFIILILYPLVGVTYFEGKVITLTKNEEGTPIQRFQNELRIHKPSGPTTRTNQDGEFTISVRVPSIPLFCIDFDFGPKEHCEIVPMRCPTPFISLFNPNRKKIYYVPGSTISDKFGINKRFFLSPKNAVIAFAGIEGDKIDKNGEGQGMHFQLPQILSNAYATDLNFTSPTGIILIRRIQLSNIKDAKEVYFDIKIDNTTQTFDGIPNKHSSKMNYLTIIPEIPVVREDLQIPVRQGKHNVAISVYTPGLFFAPLKLGSITVPYNKQYADTTAIFRNKDILLECTFIPPIAINTISQRNNKKKGYYYAVLWVDIAAKHLNKIAKVTYNLGEYYTKQYVTTPVIEKEFNYLYTLYMNIPHEVKAKITFNSGNSILLSRNISFKNRTPTNYLEYFIYAHILNHNGQEKQAYKYIQKSIEEKNDCIPAYFFKVRILEDMGAYDEALLIAEKMIAINSENPIALVSYASLVAKYLPNPSITLLNKAKQYIQEVVSIRPSPLNYDIYGWIEYRLGNYSNAAKHLLTAKELPSAGKNKFSWVYINYHLGMTYLETGSRKKAKDAFKEVVEYYNNYPMKFVVEYYENSKVELKKL